MGQTLYGRCVFTPHVVIQPDRNEHGQIGQLPTTNYGFCLALQASRNTHTFCSSPVVCFVWTCRKNLSKERASAIWFRTATETKCMRAETSSVRSFVAVYSTEGGTGSMGSMGGMSIFKGETEQRAESYRIQGRGLQKHSCCLGTASLESAGGKAESIRKLGKSVCGRRSNPGDVSG